MQTSARALAVLSLVLTALIFGFFFAWVCSTMWGLDAAPPEVAIAAMQAMNASVRNAVFAPAFFGTPVALLLAAAAIRHQRAAGWPWFLAAGLVYIFGGMILTLTVNVPMNEALAAVVLPLPDDEARAIWAGYSPRWQMFNVIRAVASGAALGLGLMGFWRLARS